MATDFTGKTTLITWAGRGIGRAVAHESVGVLVGRKRGQAALITAQAA